MTGSEVPYSIRSIRFLQHGILLLQVEVREEGGTPAIVESIRAGLAMKTKQTVIRIATTFLYFFNLLSIPRKRREQFQCFAIDYGESSFVINISCTCESVMHESLIGSRVSPFRLKNLFAYKQNKANLDPFHLCFTISL